MNVNNIYLVNNLNKNIYIEMFKKYSLLKNYYNKLLILKLLKTLYNLKQLE